MNQWIIQAGIVFALLTPLSGFGQEKASPYFQIRVIDEQTGRGVPLVELETVNNILYVTDSNGIVAFYEPGLMDQTVFFHVRSHGYEIQKDGFGMAGVRLQTKPGGSATVHIQRQNIAERLYRITGQGIYRDSVLTGAPVPLREPVLNGGVLGQDSVLPALYRGRIYWFWGDTNRASYPLGNFRMSGATSELVAKGGLPPSQGIDLNYFVNEDGFCRPLCPIVNEGLIWIDGVTVLNDESGQERMVARYSHLRKLGDVLGQGLVRFNDDTQTFDKWLEIDLANQWRLPRGHAMRSPDTEDQYVYYMIAYPVVRARADLESLADPNAYEAFSCLAPGETFRSRNSVLERDAQGRPIYGWKKNTDPVEAKEEQELIQHGLLKPEEAHFLPRDVESGEPVAIHSGSVYWNAYRKRWILIGVQMGGKSSFLGEVWYSEADAPTGPWRRVRKIVTHDQYTFYNPVHHPFFDEDGGRLIYFEGTYSRAFSNAPSATPRYDYNQIMYRLDLADPRLRLENP
ncbi:MAG TPA: hypothetical protein PLH79_02225 [bacterium]|nr:hypothetical protein [bacterium]